MHLICGSSWSYGNSVYHSLSDSQQQKTIFFPLNTTTAITFCINQVVWKNEDWFFIVWYFLSFLLSPCNMHISRLVCCYSDFCRMRSTRKKIPSSIDKMQPEQGKKAFIESFRISNAFSFLICGKYLLAFSYNIFMRALLLKIKSFDRTILYLNWQTINRPLYSGR